MKCSFKKLFLIIAILSTFPLAAHAQNLSLSGCIYKYNHYGPYPIPIVGYQIFIFSQMTQWIGPAISDGYGRYAFYNVPSGQYLMIIRNGSYQLWQQMVIVPGSLPPIVLP